MNKSTLATQIKNFSAQLTKKDSYMHLVLPKSFELLEAKEGAILHKFQVEQKHLNNNNSLHGGFIASMIDIGGSLVINSMGLNDTGVSTDINISYISGAKLDESVYMLSEANKIGANLAFTTVKIWKMDNDVQKVIALGRHTKFIRYAQEKLKQNE